MKLKKKFDRGFYLISRAVQKICSYLLLVMIFAVTLQVVGRIFLFKLPWTEEVGTYTLIWMTFIGSIAVLIRGEHLTVDLFLLRYTPMQRRIARVVINVVLLAFCGILLIFGTKLCQSPIILNGRTPALAISRVWIYLSLPISMLFNTAFSLYSLTVAVIDLVTGGKLTEEKEVTE